MSSFSKLNTSSASLLITILRENRLAAIIQHPNICPVYEVGTDGGFPYIVMRVVPSTLSALLKRLQAPMPPKSAVAVVRKLALGLVAAHAQKVVHRDLKPANVLYDEANREVLIADFGLARFADQATEASNGVPKGTPAYMSPEQARGRADEVGTHSDIYSLGVMLYEMLTGKVPFTGSVWQVMRDHCETTPPPPSQMYLGVDPELDTIVLKAMAKRPADRYVNAKAFAQALADYLMVAERGGSVSQIILPPITDVRPKSPSSPVVEVVETKPASAPKPPPKPVAATLVEDEVTPVKKAKKPNGKRAKDKKKGGLPVSVWVGIGTACAAVVIVLVLVVTSKKPDPPLQVNAPVAPAPDKPVPPLPNTTEVERKRKQAEDDFKLGVDYRWGKNGKTKHLAMAREWYEKAANQGHGEAQNELGDLYFHGYLGKVDYVKAREWYEKAAAQGHTHSQYALGGLYANGAGMESRDYVKARAWYEKAAAQENSRAKFKLGELYELGNGVLKNIGTALEWYRKAAAQGDREAQLAVVRLEKKKK